MKSQNQPASQSKPAILQSTVTNIIDMVGIGTFVFLPLVIILVDLISSKGDCPLSNFID